MVVLALLLLGLPGCASQETKGSEGKGSTEAKGAEADVGVWNLPEWFKHFLENAETDFSRHGSPNVTTSSGSGVYGAIGQGIVAVTILGTVWIVAHRFNRVKSVTLEYYPPKERKRGKDRQD
jgi:hypothetical protein